MECKYKLPCNWCDKFNKQCTECDSSYEPLKIHLQDCDHNWELDHWYVQWSENEQCPIKSITFRCIKCGETKIEKYIDKEN